MIWFRVLEVWLTARVWLLHTASSGIANLVLVQLLASPTFHRAVRHVHKRVHEIRHGKDPADLGGMNIDSKSTLSTHGIRLMISQSPAGPMSKNLCSILEQS
jgi:hypothetical protein